jgi:hypothetical protein
MRNSQFVTYVRSVTSGVYVVEMALQEGSQRAKAKESVILRTQRHSIAEIMTERKNAKRRNHEW